VFVEAATTKIYAINAYRNVTYGNTIKKVSLPTSFLIIIHVKN